MGETDFAWANGLRRAHFPAERNRLSAHITLFHHLPPSVERDVTERLKQMTANRRPAATLAGLLNLGGGVAYRIESPELLAMRQELADAFQGLLTPQDSAKPRLHITVQNKVPAAEARDLLHRLETEFKPRPFEISGLAAWWYRGGPWEEIRQFRFRR